MKKPFSIIVLLALLSSCSSTYFYTVLDTETPYTEKKEDGVFVYESDSLWIAHSFNGENAPIQITVYNKMNVPLYVDWAKSALIIQDEVFSYYPKAGSININSYSETSAFGLIRNSYNGFYANIDYSDDIGFVPPRSKITKSTLRLNVDIKDMESIYATDSIKKNKGNKANPVKRVNFTPNNTPLKFTSYLTVFTNPDSPIIFEQDFYMASLMKTKDIKPQDLPKESQQRGDVFYTIKPADDSALGVIFGIAIIAGATYLDAKNSTHDSY